VLFTTEPYLLFLPAVVAINWAIPPRLRPAFLLAASYYFYASWNPPYLLLIFVLTLANYFLGSLQGRSEPRRLSLLLAAIAVNLGALGIFKYLGWLDGGAVSLAHLLGLSGTPPLIQLVLPLGLSFFTFEFVHYQVDLYRGGEPITNPIRFALFPAFFPTQIAGPIKRYEDFDAQVGRRPRFDGPLFLEGLELIAVGMFKKVVIADNLARMAAIVFGNTAAATSGDAVLGAMAFYFQVYFDFSGYSDIARGSAQLFGYRIPINFNAPFLATSVQDVWQRWHMSLTFWLRDYVFYPLVFSRALRRLGGRTRAIAAVMITGTLCGMWHGAGSQYVLFGLLMGFDLVLDRILIIYLWRRVPARARMVGGWVQCQVMIATTIALFAAPIPVAFSLWQHELFGGLGFRLLNPLEVIEIVGIFSATVAIQVAMTRWKPRELVSRLDLSSVLRPAYAMSVSAVALYFSVADAVFALNPRKFIYFQF
jgi:alginate O-acetyltransferase complex protein AlgI